MASYKDLDIILCPRTLSICIFIFICFPFDLGENLQITILPYEKSQWNQDCHYENTLIQVYRKTENFQIKKNSDIFQISAQNIDCGYSLEPPRRGGSNKNSQFMFLSRNKKK